MAIDYYKKRGFTPSEIPAIVNRSNENLLAIFEQKQQMLEEEISHLRTMQNLLWAYGIAWASELFLFPGECFGLLSGMAPTYAMYIVLKCHG